MARIDDYNNAYELGRETLKDKNPKRVADRCGADLQTGREGNVSLSLPFLGRRLGITWPELRFSYEGSDDEVPIEHQVLLLHYLSGSLGSRPTHEWIAYQEIPDGRFYLDAFTRRAKFPMVQAFGRRPELLVSVAGKLYGAETADHGDYSVLVRALPMVPVMLILWEGDEEFPPDGNILFDRSIAEILSAEDTAWLAGMVVYPLIGKAKSEGS